MVLSESLMYDLIFILSEVDKNLLANLKISVNIFIFRINNFVYSYNKFNLLKSLISKGLNKEKSGF